MIYDEGFDKMYDILNEAMEVSIIKKAGSWYKWGKVSYQGLSNFRLAMNKDPELLDELREEILEKIEEKKIY